MTVTEAVRQRISTRAFLDTPIPREQLADLLEIAQRAPSGGNLQPWHINVVAGTKLDELKAIAQRRPHVIHELQWRRAGAAFIAVDNDEVWSDTGFEYGVDNGHKLPVVANAELESDRLAARKAAEFRDKF